MNREEREAQKEAETAAWVARQLASAPPLTQLQIDLLRRVRRDLTDMARQRRETEADMANSAERRARVERRIQVLADILDKMGDTEEGVLNEHGQRVTPELWLGDLQKLEDMLVDALEQRKAVAFLRDQLALIVAYTEKID